VAAGRARANREIDAPLRRRWRGGGGAVAVAGGVVRHGEGQATTMGADYIPEKDYKAASFMKNLARQLVEDPEGYLTTPDDAAQIDNVVLAFRTANAKAHTPGVISSSLIRAKNDARKAAERLVRPAYQRLRTEPRIPSELKLRAGVKLTKKRRRYVGPPESAANVFAECDNSGRVTIKVNDSVRIRRAKPPEASGFELFERVRSQALIKAIRERKRRANEDKAAVAATTTAATTTAITTTATTTISAASRGWQYVGMFTAAPITIIPHTAQDGDFVTYAARWVNRRGEPGPFGQTSSVVALHNPAAALGSFGRVRRRTPAA
jgi:hypothetical protein